MNIKRLLPFFRTRILHLSISSYPMDFNEEDKNEHLRRSLANTPYPKGVLAICCDTVSFDPAKISREEVITYLTENGIHFSVEKETTGFGIGF